MIKKKVTVIALIILLLSIIPVVYSMKYSMPANLDDWSYILKFSNTIGQNNSFFDIFSKVIIETGKYYNEWQGAYFSIFLSILQPATIDLNLYFIMPVFVLFLHIFSIFYLMKKIYNCVLKTNDSSWILISCIISFLQIQNIPSISEGFYWHAGAVMHTLPFSLLLINYGLLLEFLVSIKKSFFKLSILIVLSLLIGGTGYEVALFNFTSLAGLLLFNVVFDKLNHQKSKNKVYVIFILLTTTIGLLINVLAPGNMIRAEVSGVSIPAYLAILESFVYSIIHCFEYISLGTIVLVVIVFYFSYPYLKKIEIKLPNMYLFIALIWGVYSSMFTPAIFGENYVASPRYLNILYFAFYWVLIIVEIYIIKYLSGNKILSEVYGQMRVVIHKIPNIVVFSLGILVFSSVFQFSYMDATSSRILVDIISGRFSSYINVRNERVKALESEDRSIEIPGFNENFKITTYMDSDFMIDNELYEIVKKAKSKSEIVIK